MDKRVNGLKMKLAFVDFWGNFDHNNNFFVHYFKKLLKKEPLYIVNKDDADIAIYTCFGNEHSSINRSKTKKIFFTGENIRPDFNQCDYSFTFDFDDYGGKNIRIPLWYMYIDWFGIKTYGNPSYLIPPSEFNGKWFNTTKEKDCCTVFSNPKHERFLMINALSKYMQVECYGKPFGKHTDGEEDKYQKISQYKTSICFENGIQSGYVTEKLLHARTAGNLPIYCGHSDVKYDFNPEGFINANDFKSFEECAEYANTILNNHDKYNNMLKAPIFNCKFFEFDAKVYNIF